MLVCIVITTSLNSSSIICTVTLLSAFEQSKGNDLMHTGSHMHIFKKTQRTLRKHQEILNWIEVGPAPWMESSRVFLQSKLLSYGYSNLHLSVSLETTIYNPGYPLPLFYMPHSVCHALHVALCRSKWIISSWSTVLLRTNVISTMGCQLQSELFGSQIYLQVFVKKPKNFRKLFYVLRPYWPPRTLKVK